MTDLTHTPAIRAAVDAGDANACAQACLEAYGPLLAALKAATQRGHFQMLGFPQHASFWQDVQTLLRLEEASDETELDAAIRACEEGIQDVRACLPAAPDFPQVWVAMGWQEVDGREPIFLVARSEAGAHQAWADYVQEQVQLGDEECPVGESEFSLEYVCQQPLLP